MTEGLTYLFEQLFRSQLVQFGRFAHDGQLSRPYSLLFDMLPSYPDILAHAARQICAAPISSERLVCDRESLPLATAVSLQSGIPLVYSGNPYDHPVDLAGAYDIGHPATLILNTLEHAKNRDFFTSAERVGLIIGETRAFCGLRLPTEHESCVFRLETYVTYLVKHDKLPAGQASSLLAYLQH